jgi:transposase
MEAAKRFCMADEIAISPSGLPPKDLRLILEAILHRLRVGCPWRDLPQGFGSWSSVDTRWSRWNHSGLWQRILALLADSSAVGELRHLDATHRTAMCAYASQSIMRNGLPGSAVRTNGPA